MDQLLSIDDLSRADIDTVLETAAVFQAEGPRIQRRYPTLRGKTVLNLFFESSTRTRMSFEIAAKRLSADVVNFTASGSSVDKGESLKDTAQTIEAMGVDAIVLRHRSSGAPWRLKEWVSAKILNAGDGTHEHPTQGLLDLYTIKQHLGRLDGLRVAVVGDIRHSRVAGSLIRGLRKVGSEPVLVGPRTLMPVADPGLEMHTSLDEVLPKVDVCYMLRIQRERMDVGFLPSLREYETLWGLDARRAALLSPDALIMHPGPMNRGLEIAAAVADDPRSKVLDQVANGVAIRMALLYLMLGGQDARSEETDDG